MNEKNKKKFFEKLNDLLEQITTALFILFTFLYLYKHARTFWFTAVEDPFLRISLVTIVFVLWVVFLKKSLDVISRGRTIVQIQLREPKNYSSSDDSTYTQIWINEDTPKFLIGRLGVTTGLQREVAYRRWYQFWKPETKVIREYHKEKHDLDTVTISITTP